MHTWSAIACHKLTFSSAERRSYDKLVEAIFGRLDEIVELEDGYAFRYPFESGMLQHIAEWIPLELKCCPFLEANVKINASEGIKLTLTGPPEVKQFLLQELRLA